MILALTLMVRDEADVIAAMLEHHLAQGVDRIVVTDNGSVDGTREILEDYARVAPITLLHDPEHRKQQGEVVTRMARRAAVEHGADWVINGDADEFVRPVDPALTLRDAFAELPRAIGSFRVPVVNLVGPLALRGSGLRRLVHRDLRSEEALRRAGLVAHPTPNAVHVGDAEVEVAQGNHRVSIPESGPVPDALALEVLHLPWRSMAQIERKTRNMGEGYDASPHLHPSPRHHGMRDWRRMRAGLLLPFVAWRMPVGEELSQPWFPEDRSLLGSLEALDALRPEHLAATLDDAHDEVLPADAIEAERAAAALVEPFERIVLEELTNARLDADALRADRDSLGVQLEGTRGHADRLERELAVARDGAAAAQEQLARMAASRAHRAEMLARRALRLPRRDAGA